ncbi:MAG: M24 family metallopeptidase, partial [Tissierellia bacterium]|nr:M24 family metallopeptidase [Tissierellia bacterium]
MIVIKTEEEIQMMKKAGEILANTHKELAKIIKPGITTYEIDEFVEEYLAKHNATPEQKGYRGFPYAICASINDEICHGFPRKKSLNDGDIITIDMVVNLD